MEKRLLELIYAYFNLAYDIFILGLWIMIGQRSMNNFILKVIKNLSW